jgi:hypothetical protein
LILEFNTLEEVYNLAELVANNLRYYYSTTAAYQTTAALSRYKNHSEVCEEVGVFQDLLLDGEDL